jgi:hypothetical protein
VRGSSVVGCQSQLKIGSEVYFGPVLATCGPLLLPEYRDFGNASFFNSVSRSQAKKIGVNESVKEKKLTEKQYQN